jgi:hypothetical protein
VSRAASTEPSTKKILHFDHPNHDEESMALLPPLSNLQCPFPHESRPTPLPAMMWRFRPLPLSGRVPPRVCFPPLDFAGGGLINQPLLALNASPEAADTSPLLPQIDIDPIEPWRRGEGELFLYLASYFN